MLSKKCFLILVFSVLWFLQTTAQRNHFVYLQTESMEPFYVVLNKKNISSSSAGHIILSGLQPGNYNIQVGFPKDNGVLDYFIELADADKGFILKKSGENGITLVNMQSLEVQQSGEVRKAKEEAEKQKLLAEAKKKEEEAAAMLLREEQARQKKTADSLALIQEQEKKQKEAENQMSKSEDSIKAIRVEVPPAETNTGEETKKTVETVTKAGEKSGNPTAGNVTNPVAPVGAVVAGGVATVAVGGNNKETVLAEAKNEPPNIQSVSQVLSATEIAKLQEEARRIDATGNRDSALAAQKANGVNKTATPAFLDMEMTMPDSTKSENTEKMKTTNQISGLQDSAKVTEKKSIEPVVTDGTKPVTDVAVAPAKTASLATKTNPNCSEEISDSELDLIAQIAKREKDPEDGLAMLKKTFKIKCVNTRQVRKLCLQFAADPIRYDLLDMAYRYTTDRENYTQLADLLTDIYFINRFKAMIQ